AGKVVHNTVGRDDPDERLADVGKVDIPKWIGGNAAQIFARSRQTDGSSNAAVTVFVGGSSARHVSTARYRRAAANQRVHGVCQSHGAVRKRDWRVGIDVDLHRRGRRS